MIIICNIDNKNKKLTQCSKVCTSVQQCRYQFGLKTLPQGQDIKGNFVACDKICGQMLNNFTTFRTVFYNFYVALFSVINDLFSFILQLKCYYRVTWFI